MKVYRINCRIYLKTFAAEADVKTALKEVKLALLEADVSFKVVKQFIKAVQERAIGQDVMNGLNPGQMVIKIVNDELVNLMGSETTEIALRPASEVTVIMMAGLQGAGKTTTTAKLAGKFKSKGRKPLLVACDVYRPAAITQLQINGEKQGVEVFSMGDKQNPVNIAKAAVEHAKSHGFNVVILDTAGRLHVDEAMMEELQNIKEAVHVDQTILVVDAMTGQEAVNVADSFNQKLELDGVILTKLDGDTRGGAALSIKATCGKKASTLPTPPTTPSAASPIQKLDTPSSGSALRRKSAACTKNCSAARFMARPMPPKQIVKIMDTTAAKIGNARKRLSANVSNLSDQVCGRFAACPAACRTIASTAS